VIKTLKKSLSWSVPIECPNVALAHFVVGPAWPVLGASLVVLFFAIVIISV